MSRPNGCSPRASRSAEARGARRWDGWPRAALNWIASSARGVRPWRAGNGPGRRGSPPGRSASNRRSGAKRMELSSGDAAVAVSAGGAAAASELKKRSALLDRGSRASQGCSSGAPANRARDYAALAGARRAHARAVQQAEPAERADRAARDRSPAQRTARGTRAQEPRVRPSGRSLARIETRSAPGQARAAAAASQASGIAGHARREGGRRRTETRAGIRPALTAGPARGVPVAADVGRRCRAARGAMDGPRGHSRDRDRL